MLNFGFSTFFFVNTHILDAVDDIVASGIRTIEVCCEMPHILDMDDDFISRMHSIRDTGIEFSFHAPFNEINLGSTFGYNRGYAVERMKSALHMAHRIGCDPFVVHPGHAMSTGKAKDKDIDNTTRENFLEDLREITGFAKERGIRVALENVYVPYYFFRELEEFKEIHKAVPDLGITLDIGHAYITKRSKGEKDPEGAIIREIKQAGIEQLYHVHLHNNRGVKDDHLFLEGDIDLKRILQGLDRLSYAGKVVVESYDMEKQGADIVLKKLKEISP